MSTMLCLKSGFYTFGLEITLMPGAQCMSFLSEQSGCSLAGKMRETLRLKMPVELNPKFRDLAGSVYLSILVSLST